MSEQGKMTDAEIVESYISDLYRKTVVSDYTPTKDRIVSWLMEGAYTGRGADHRAEAFERWLAEHDAALIEGLADEVHATLSDPNRKRPRDPQGEFATDLLNDVAWAVHLIREKARQRREEKP